MNGVLTVVKKFSNGNLLVRCSNCSTYDVITPEEYSDYLNSNKTSCKRCAKCKRTRYRMGMHQPYGMLRPLSRLVNKSGLVAYVCKCDCGNFVIRRDSVVNSGYSRSCGCKTGDFYDFEWSGSENYIVTDIDYKSMDKLVSLLGRDLDINAKLCVSSDEVAEQEKANSVTMDSLRDKFKHPDNTDSDDSEFEEDLISDDSSDEVAPWDDCSDSEGDIKVSEVCSTKVDEKDLSVKDETSIFSELIGDNLLCISLKADMSQDLMNLYVDNLCSPERLYRLTHKDKDVTSIVDFLGDARDLHLNDIVDSIYNSNSAVLVKKIKGKIELILVVTKDVCKCYTYYTKKGVISVLLGLLSGLYAPKR